MKFSFPFKFIQAIGIALALCAHRLPTARADVTVSETKDDRGLTVYKLTLTPAAEPAPTFRYRLMARDMDLEPGNAAPYYYRAMLDLQKTVESLNHDFGEAWQNWYSVDSDGTPLAQLPRDKVRKAINMSRTHIEEQLARAVKQRDCDWQLGLNEMRGADNIISFLLPEMQQSRSLSRLLSLRTRLAIAEGRTDDALTTIRMNYRLATDVARTPLLVCGLVGIAEAGLANNNVIELIAQPGSPNLYWALTELPQPLLDLRAASRFELELPWRAFPFLRNAETTDRSAEEWNLLYKQSYADLRRASTSLTAFGGSEELFGLALMGYPHAKKKLIEQGMNRERVEKMAVGQVIAIYTERTCQRLADDAERLSFLPYAEMRKRYPEIERKLQAARPLGSSDDREVLPVMSMLMPEMLAVSSAQIRLERDMAALRIVEALRLYAAGHDGRLPETLDQITEVPIPQNPATERPFVYRLDGTTGILELPVSDGVSVSRRLEIAMKAK